MATDSACPEAQHPALQGTVDEVLAREWLLTDGLGGFAFGTPLGGCPTRRYHGLLVGSLRPPLQRYVLLANTLDHVVVGEESVDLSTFEFVDVFHPAGYRRLAGFERGTDRGNPFVEFAFQHEGFTARKRIAICYGRRAVRLTYEVQACGDQPVQLKIDPLIALRDFHVTNQFADLSWWTLESSEEGLLARSSREKDVSVAIFGSRGKLTWRQEPIIWKAFRYRVEDERGMPDREDLLKAGSFVSPVGTKVTCELSAVGFVNSLEAGREALKARRAAVPYAPSDEVLRDETTAALTRAADQFVVRRYAPEGEGHKATIIAGYPWFGDWGRDSFIALEGLLLIPGRFKEAEQVLATFSGAQRNGLIPNLFNDYGGQCAYNSVDASLWFIHAADAYLRYSGNAKAWKSFLFEACRNVIQAFCDGTDYDIGLEDRGLVHCGRPDTQITWMDAKCDDVVFTPRHGIPVEVNALWYHALHIVADRTGKLDHPLVVVCRELIDELNKSFAEVFWNDAAGCLYDWVRGEEADPSIRPNQIFAVSLEHSPLAKRRRQAVLDVVTDELLTPYGLRTLSPDHLRYFGRFTGSRYDRDHAYHNGTVWSWLIGPYVEAHLRMQGFTRRAKAYARKLLKPLIDHLNEVGLGTISEVFDADPPHTPRGCPAQAWGVAEVLRAWRMTEPD